MIVQLLNRGIECSSMKTELCTGMERYLSLHTDSRQIGGNG
jgi:hypothetical protein